MKKSALFIMSFFMVISVSLFAEQTPIKTLHHYTLKNGLELFVAENHIVPLATIEIVVRGGAIAHTPENAGLFHLYEHMMFKGNSKYKTSEAMQQAIQKLGVSSYNGTTGTEHINYYFTVPSDRVQEGLEFWNSAIRTPLLNKKEFEAEKKVVLSEINGNFAPNVDCGDYVIIVNAEKVSLSGDKLNNKKYYNVSGFPGGLRTRTAKEMVERYPVEMLERCVHGMVPKGRLGRQIEKKLFVYAGPEHKQEAQKPEVLELKF